MSLPSTPLLDDFSRPDENPLSKNGAWLVADTTETGGNEVLNRQLRGTVDGDDQVMYWSLGDVAADTEVWTRLATAPSGGSVYLLSRLTQLGGAGTYDGYRARFTGVNTWLYRVVNSTGTLLDSTAFAVQANDLCVFRIVGYVLTAYVVRGGFVIQVLSATDEARTSASGRMGVALTNTAGPYLSGVGGGDLSVRQVPAAHGQAGRGAIP